MRLQNEATHSGTPRLEKVNPAFADVQGSINMRD
jgi:hypothetical protein